VFFEAFRNQLIAELGTKVRIVKSTETTGKVEIEYYSIDDLERLYELFSGKEQPKPPYRRKNRNSLCEACVFSDRRWNGECTYIMKGN
jgi:hypothetical protein